jgi:ATP-binding cassette, subfamily B, bacterial
LASLSEVWGEVQLAAGAAERISELLDETPQIAPPANPQPLPNPPRGEVGFRPCHLQLPHAPRYKGAGRCLLQVATGETVAIVGPSGAGKTTIFSLVQRFFDPQSGMVWSMAWTSARRIRRRSAPASPSCRRRR